MVNEWTDSGKWDGRKSVKVGNGMGSEWADSGTVYLVTNKYTFNGGSDDGRKFHFL